MEEGRMNLHFREEDAKTKKPWQGMKVHFLFQRLDRKKSHRV